MNPATFETVRQLTAALLSVPAQSLDANGSLDSVEGWDSVQQLNLVLSLEETFNLQFAPEDYESMTSLGKICEMVDAKSST